MWDVTLGPLKSSGKRRHVDEACLWCSISDSVSSIGLSSLASPAQPSQPPLETMPSFGQSTCCTKTHEQTLVGEKGRCVSSFQNAWGGEVEESKSSKQGRAAADNGNKNKTHSAEYWFFIITEVARTYTHIHTSQPAAGTSAGEQTAGNQSNSSRPRPSLKKYTDRVLTAATGSQPGQALTMGLDEPLKSSKEAASGVFPAARCSYSQVPRVRPLVHAMTGTIIMSTIWLVKSCRFDSSLDAALATGEDCA